MAIHDGHRGRMRKRFAEEGLEGFAPHEVLELLLFYGRSRGNTNPIAHALLEKFGSLHGVLEADVEQLQQVEGIGEESATLISLVLPLFRKYGESVCSERKQITTLAEAQEYCRALLSGYRSEHFYCVSLSSKGEVLGCRLIAEGTLGEVAAYPRLIAETALNQNAHSVLLCHNHPGGNVQPSGEDVQTTKLLRQLLQMMDISLLDHIIVTEEATFSMAAAGLIKE